MRLPVTRLGPSQPWGKGCRLQAGCLTPHPSCWLRVWARASVGKGSAQWLLLYPCLLRPGFWPQFWEATQSTLLGLSDATCKVNWLLQPHLPPNAAGANRVTQGVSTVNPCALPSGQRALSRPHRGALGWYLSILAVCLKTWPLTYGIRYGRCRARSSAPEARKRPLL